MNEDIDIVLNWIEVTPMTARLKNSLQRYHRLHPKESLDEISSESFLGMTGVGKLQWAEFELLRKQSK